MNENDIFQGWSHWFRSHPIADIPWAVHEKLPLSVRKRIQGPLREFQLGEQSEARHLLRKAEAYARRQSRPAYLDAIQAFIAEEQRHAAWLGELLDREAIPRARVGFLDVVFRQVRHRLPLAHTVATLMVAEVIAELFYQALRDATPSVVLKTICTQILQDEILHLRFQAHALHQFRTDMSVWRRLSLDAWAKFALESAIHLVWIKANELLLDGGFDFPRFSRSCRAQFLQLWAIVRGEAPLNAPLLNEFDRRRLFLPLLT